MYHGDFMVSSICFIHEDVEDTATARMSCPTTGAIAWTVVVIVFIVLEYATQVLHRVPAGAAEFNPSACATIPRDGNAPPQRPVFAFR